MSEEVYNQFIDRAEKINNLEQVNQILNWDQEVIMPNKGVNARSMQQSTISGIKHQLLSDNELETLIEKLEKQELNEKQQANLREIQKDHKKARKVPKELIEEISSTASTSVDTWRRAKKEDDFDAFAPHLKKMVKLKRKYAEHINPEAEPYKVLFKDYEPFFDFEKMESILEQLRKRLKPLIQKISEQGDDITTDTFQRNFSTEQQRKFSRDILEDLGFDFDRGRFDTSSHPFTMGNQFDSRITSRFEKENLAGGFLATIHEFGHALYQLNLPQDQYGSPIGTAREMSIHESQSRLWENHVGRSKSFWTYCLPKIQNHFPSQCNDKTVKDCYESSSQVFEDNLIRVEADELTYHMHIILRFELGRKLIRGDITVDQLPQLWNQKMEEYLGIRPETDKKGVLQDIHWAWGNFGYFPTYTLGSVLAAQFYNTASNEIDNLDSKIAEGNFKPLRDWLKENIHSQGKRYKTEELVEKVTGEKPTADYFLDYVESKYTDLYDL